MVGAGGMPSSHSALVCSLTVALSRKLGFTSPEFALSLVFAAVVGLLAASYVGGVENSGASEESLTSAKVLAWQAIFWVCAIPGLFLFFGSFRLSESPRYLFRRGRKDEAMAVLVRSYGDARAKEVFDEMVHIEEEEKQKAEELKKQSSSGESLLQRKYIYPFVLAVLVLAFTQATGINSVLNYSVKVFQQAGLEGTTANWADFTIKVVNCLMTIVAMVLVDRKGRKFLLKIGTAGIVVGLLGTGFLFNNVEKARKDVTADVAALLAAQSPSVQKEFEPSERFNWNVLRIPPSSGIFLPRTAWPTRTSTGCSSSSPMTSRKPIPPGTSS